MRGYTKEERAGLLFTIPTTIFILAFFLIPTIQAILNSLRTGEGILSLDNYRYILSDSIFYLALTNTFYFAFMSTMWSILIGLGLALLLNEEFRGRRLCHALIITPLAIPQVAVGILFRWIWFYDYGTVNEVLKQLGLLTRNIAWLALVHDIPFFNVTLNIVTLAEAWYWTALVTIMLLAALQTIPVVYYEAAKIDGLSRWRRFTDITLPFILPALTLAALIKTMWSFRGFDVIYIMTRGGPGYSTYTVPFYLYLQNFLFLVLERGSAVGIILMIITVVMILIVLRASARALR